MINQVLNHYRQIFQGLEKLPQAALEVGALPTQHGILTCDELKQVPKKIGINLQESGSFAGVEVITGDARCMPFEDNSFDLIVSSSTLEHIPDFWLACNEMKRVLAPEGMLIINAPGLVEKASGNKIRRIASIFNLPDFIKRTTMTFPIHDAPHDYYRFTIHSFQDVIMQGLSDVKIWSIMSPPRIFATGIKK